jgi:DNA-binding winged helix-turn-helix (wHTH) protein
MIGPAVTRMFRFADFELDLAAYALRHRGESVKLEKIPMELLILMVEHAGTLIERSEIKSRLWGAEVFVEHDAAINTAIRKIRHALGDDAARPHFVETVVGKGYKFIAPLESVTGRLQLGEPAVEDRAQPLARQPRRPFARYSITVGKQEFILNSGETLLGRDPAAGVYVEHPSVSRRHARISIEADQAILQDSGSRNGTFLNGRRVDGLAKIHHNDIIALGPITLVFHVTRTPASTQSMSPGEIKG